MESSCLNSCVKDTAITRVLVLCKTHLDVGFTDFARTVREKYLTSFIPGVIRAARTLERENTGENLVWNTGSYIIYEYWRRSRGAARAEFEAAVRDGILAYHALPFTVHSEFFDAPLFQAMLADARELDRAFHRHTRAAKMTDVPGHSIGIVPLLADNGVEFLHWGINPASYPPHLPQLFRWQYQGKELVVMYAGNGYGSDATLPDQKTRVVFLHGGDNSTPPGLGLIRQSFRELRLQYPQAIVRMGTLEDLAELVLAGREALPVVTGEIGDSWIHGVATDCVKSARFRELLRLRRELPEKKIPRAFDRHLGLVGEHTWGMDIKTHLADDTHWLRPEFAAAREQLPNFRKVEKSWQEQRDYLTGAVAALPPKWRAEAGKRLAALEPRHWDFTGADNTPPVVTTATLRATFDGHGNLATLQTPFAIAPPPEGEAFFAVHYHTYDQDATMRYLREYCQWDGSVAKVAWAAWDMGKIGLPANLHGQVYTGHATAFLVDDSDAAAVTVRVRIAMPERPVNECGAPRSLEIAYRFSRRLPELEITVQYFDKAANRLPEALCASFHTAFTPAADWRLNKLGMPVNPATTVTGGGTQMHALGDEKSLTITEAGHTLTVASPDVPLLLIGAADLWRYRAEPESPAGQFAFCLSNNQWGTNFPQWSEDNFRCRFRLCFSGN